MCRVLETKYGISISPGRVYRLMKGIQLPKMFTIKPKFKAAKQSESLPYPNIFNAEI